MSSEKEKGEHVGNLISVIMQLDSMAAEMETAGIKEVSEALDKALHSALLFGCRNFKEDGFEALLLKRTSSGCENKKRNGGIHRPK